MNSIVLIVMQIPTVAILFFAVYLFREVQKDRAALQAARETLENAKFEGGDSDSSQEFETIRNELSDLKNQLSEIEAGGSDEGLTEAERDQLSNQKRALKEFGRVLSKSSEQTYTEMQELDRRINDLEHVLESNGFTVRHKVDAA